MISNAAKLSLWVHGWKRRNDDGHPTIELDWTEHFDLDVSPRRIADQATWTQHLLPSLQTAKQQFPMGSVIEVRGLLPLSAALVIGTQFLNVEGYTLQVWQRTSGMETLWQSNASGSEARFRVVEEVGQAGENVLLFLAVTGAARAEGLQLYRELGMDAIVYADVYAEPALGAGERAVASDADAVALAIDARRLIGEVRDRLGARCVHLVLYCPMGFALFLGQRLRFVGEVLTYERVGEGQYCASVRLETN